MVIQKNRVFTQDLLSYDSLPMAVLIQLSQRKIDVSKELNNSKTLQLDTNVSLQNFNFVLTSNNVLSSDCLVDSKSKFYTNQYPKQSTLSVVSPFLNLTSKEEIRAPLALYSDDSLGSTATNETIDSNIIKLNKTSLGFNPSSVTSMMDENNDGTLEMYANNFPIGILKQQVTNTGTMMSSNSPKQRNKSKNVMFSTSVMVDDGSKIVRLNCTLDDSELNKNKVAPTERLTNSPITKVNFPKSKINSDKTEKMKSSSPISNLNLKISNELSLNQNDNQFSSNSSNKQSESKIDSNMGLENVTTISDSVSNLVNTVANSNINTNKSSSANAVEESELFSNAPTPPPRRSSQITGSDQCSSVTAKTVS